MRKWKGRVTVVLVVEQIELLELLEVDVFPMIVFKTGVVMSMMGGARRLDDGQDWWFFRGGSFEVTLVDDSLAY